MTYVAHLMFIWDGADLCTGFWKRKPDDVIPFYGFPFLLE